MSDRRPHGRERIPPGNQADFPSIPNGSKPQRTRGPREDLLHRAARDVITDLWTHLTAGSPETLQSDSSLVSQALGDALLDFYDPDEILLNPHDERITIAAQRHARRVLNGDESTEQLIRHFASRAGLPLERAQRGFRGGRQEVKAEFYRYARHFRSDPDAIIGLIKGMLVQTFGSQPATGRRDIHLCELLCSILLYAIDELDLYSEELRDFLASLTCYIHAGLHDAEWPHSYESTDHLIELLEATNDPTEHCDHVLNAVWHALLVDACTRGEDPATAATPIWLQWFVWVSSGAAKRLVRLARATTSQRRTSRMPFVRRLAEFGAMANMRLAEAMEPATSSVLTLRSWFPHWGDYERLAPEEKWLRVDRDYDQFCRAVVMLAPWWKLQDAELRTIGDARRRLFHEGAVAVASLVAAPAWDPCLDAWLELPETVRQIRQSLESRLGTAIFIELLVEEIRLRWISFLLVLWACCSGDENPFPSKVDFKSHVLPQLDDAARELWSAISFLDSRSPALEAKSQLKTGLEDLYEVTGRVLQTAHVFHGQPRTASWEFETAASLVFLDKETAAFSPYAPDRRPEMAADVRRAHDRFMGAIATGQSRRSLECPDFGRQLFSWGPPFAACWRNIFRDLSDRLDRVIEPDEIPPGESDRNTQDALRTTLCTDIAALAERTRDDSFSLAFFTPEMKPSVHSEDEPEAMTPAFMNRWKKHGPLVAAKELSTAQWTRLVQPAEISLLEFIRRATFGFLGSANTMGGG